ncbi:MAG: BTAD domain-containing putative transcriptional regulator [Myxococcota bacterium]
MFSRGFLLTMTHSRAPPDLIDAIARGRVTPAELCGIAPRELDAIFDLAAQFLDIGRDDEAADLCAGLVALFPLSARYWRAYGIALHRLLRLEEALGAYNTALVLDPQDGHTRCYRAEVLIYLGQSREARGALQDIAQRESSALKARATALLDYLDRLAPWQLPPISNPQATPHGRFTLAETRASAERRKTSDPGKCTRSDHVGTGGSNPDGPNLCSCHLRGKNTARNRRAAKPTI